MNNEQHLCDYGCGHIAIKQFGNGKWCCSEYFVKCPEIRKKKKGQIAWNKGKVYSKEERKKMSLEQIGKKHSYETKRKIGIASKNRKCSKITKRKLSKSQIGKIISIKTKNKLRLDILKIKNKYPIFSKIEEMRYNPDKPYEKEIQVHCNNHNCKNSKELGGWFTPDRHLIFDRARALNDQGGSYIYCSQKCKNECPLFNLYTDPNLKREELYTSEEYQTWRIIVLNRENFLCEYCEKPATDVHHIRPKKLESGFILDPDFGVACCKKCHYKYGHKTGTECSTGKLASTICR
jgi:hypothetical protein